MCKKNVKIQRKTGSSLARMESWGIYLEIRGTPVQWISCWVDTFGTLPGVPLKIILFYSEYEKKFLGPCNLVSIQWRVPAEEGDRGITVRGDKMLRFFSYIFHDISLRFSEKISSMNQ